MIQCSRLRRGCQQIAVIIKADSFISTSYRICLLPTAVGVDVRPFGCCGLGQPGVRIAVHNLFTGWQRDGGELALLVISVGRDAV